MLRSGKIKSVDEGFLRTDPKSVVEVLKLEVGDGV